MIETAVSNEISPLQKMVNVLNFQKDVKRDLVIPSGHIQYDGVTGLLNFDKGEYLLTEHAHDQISEKLEIPRSYYRKLKTEYPELLAKNINGWLSRKENTKYLLRTFNFGEEGTQNICRAMLSNKYNILDNFDVLIAALEAIKKAGIHVEVIKAEITEKRMYLHVVAPEIHIQATELLDGYLKHSTLTDGMLNNGIISGLLLTNSEVGLGTFEIAAASQIVVCKNRMVDRSSKFRKVHLGARMDEGIVEWSDNTKNKNYELIVSQVKDSVKTYLSKEYLGQLTSKLMSYKETQVKHPTGLIERVSQELNIPESHKENILRFFLKDNDESVFGMMNAFTRESQGMEQDKSYEVESGVFSLLPEMHKFDKPLSRN